MKKFNIEIRETLTREVTINAASLDEAIQTAENLYSSEDIVLDYTDHKTTDIDLLDLSGLDDDASFLNFVLINAEKAIKDLSIEELAKIGFGSLNSAIKDYKKN